ncbi:hypothetical protein HYALB_00007237 [Hymenoscyphus albidus]|uniref:Uncharacterized protein n=1 Tax=Hymenoscyphus albidus TaxID=595503 RepID=A0A9N9LFQ4_9HELO|nr:hypothetical protein HYALB_00007237 [Hymenoscyphus albidus]
MVTKALAGIDLHTSSNESHSPHPSNGNNGKEDKPTPRNPSIERRYKWRRNRLENFRAWREHLRRPVQERGPESLTSTRSWGAIPSWFQRSNYVPGREDNMTIKAPKKPLHIFPLGNPRDVFDNENDDETNPWLETKFSDFMGTTTEPGYKTKWKGKRMLGQGGQGRVGLWEYNGEDPSFPMNVAVKEAFSSWGKKEDACLWEVKKRISEGLENARDAAEEADINTEPLKDFEPRGRPKSTKKRKQPVIVVFAVSKSKVGVEFKVLKGTLTKISATSQSKDSLPSPSSSSSSFEPEWTKPEFGLELEKRPNRSEVADSEKVSTSESEEKGKLSRRDSDSSLKGSRSYTRFLNKGEGSPRVDSKRGRFSTDLDEVVEPTSRKPQKTTSGMSIRKGFGGKRGYESDGGDFVSPRPETPSKTSSSPRMSSPRPAIFTKSTPHQQTTPFGKDTRKDDDGKSQVVVITSRSNPRTSTARSTPKYMSEKPQVRLATEKRTVRLVEIIFSVFHIEGPVGEESILPQMPIVVGNLNSTSTVMDLKEAIRDATRFDEGRLEIVDMHFVITSLPTKCRPLEDMDNTTFEELGINGLTYPHVHINMKNEPEQEVGSGPARYGLMINVAPRSARSDKWLLEFRGLNETTRLRNLKQRVATVAKIAVANQVWLYGDRRLGDKDSGLQLRDIVRGDGATFAVWTKNPNEKIFVDYSMPGVWRGPSRVQRGVDFGTQTPAPDQRLPTQPPKERTPRKSTPRNPTPRNPTPRKSTPRKSTPRHPTPRPSPKPSKSPSRTSPRTSSTQDFYTPPTHTSPPSKKRATHSPPTPPRYPKKRKLGPIPGQFTSPHHAAPPAPAQERLLPHHHAGAARKEPACGTDCWRLSRSPFFGR